MAASASANCSATPVNKRPNMFFTSCHFSFIQPPSQMRGNQISTSDLIHSPTMSEGLLTHPSSNEINQTKKKQKQQHPERSSSSLSRIKFILLTHLQRSGPLWFRPSFGSRIVHPPADQTPCPPRCFLCPRHRSNLLPGHLRPNPSTQSGEPLSPGPLPLAWWYVPLLWPPDLNTAAWNKDSDRPLEEKMPI